MNRVLACALAFALVLLAGPAASLRASDGAIYSPSGIPLALVVTNTADEGPGTLRQVLLDANAYPYGGASIFFNIPASDSNFVDIDSALPGAIRSRMCS